MNNAMWITFFGENGMLITFSAPNPLITSELHGGKCGISHPKWHQKSYEHQAC